MSALRRSVHSFFVRHEAAWEIMMMALAVAFAAIGFVPGMVHVTPRGMAWLSHVDWGITAVFALEFAVRIGVAPSRRQYLKEHWLDLVAIIPFFRISRLARLARVARLLRLLLLVRFFRDLDTTLRHMKGIGRQLAFAKFLVATAVVVVTAAGVAALAERGVNPTMASYPAALWWAVVTVTTVGYGDVIPITTTGKLAAAVIMVGGFATWSLFVASVVTYFMTPRRTNGAPFIGELKAKLDRLNDLTEDELVALQGALDALIASKRQGLTNQENGPGHGPDEAKNLRC